MLLKKFFSWHARAQAPANAVYVSDVEETSTNTLDMALTLNTHTDYTVPGGKHDVIMTRLDERRRQLGAWIGGVPWDRIIRRHPALSSVIRRYPALSSTIWRYLTLSTKDTVQTRSAARQSLRPPSQV